MEKLNEEPYGKPEVKEPEELSESKTELDGQDSEAEEEVEDKIGLEYLRDELKVNEGLEESLEDVELPTEIEQDVEPANEIIESQTDSLLPEPSNEVIEKIEAQDLSSLEAELYQESLEPIEPKVEPGETVESSLQSEAIEQNIECEAEGY
ncbi:MAG: hypothetical protein ACPLZG_11405 [Thermoproteota archaeon]